MRKEIAEIKTLEYLEQLAFDEIIEVIHEDDEPLTPFETARFISTWLESNGYQSDHDWVFILAEIRRTPLGERKPVCKWGSLRHSKDRRNRITYNRREVLHWLSRNIHNFTPVRKAA